MEQIKLFMHGFTELQAWNHRPLIVQADTKTCLLQHSFHWPSQEKNTPTKISKALMLHTSVLQLCSGWKSLFFKNILRLLHFLSKNRDYLSLFRFHAHSLSQFSSFDLSVMPSAALPKHGNYDLRLIKAKISEEYRNRKDSFVQLQAVSSGEKAGWL